MTEHTHPNTPSRIRVRHLHQNEWGKIDAEGRRSPKGQLLATCASLINTDGSVLIGLARCNKKDKPSRQRGSSIATGRLRALQETLARQDTAWLLENLKVAHATIDGVSFTFHATEDGAKMLFDQHEDFMRYMLSGRLTRSVRDYM